MSPVLDGKSWNMLFGLIKFHSHNLYHHTLILIFLILKIIKVTSTRLPIKTKACITNQTTSI